MAKIISFFNHKGGVGKTTLVHNLGCALSNIEKKRVLLVDADPQMNLTASVYGLSTTTEYSEEENSKWREFNSTYTSIDTLISNVITSNNDNYHIFKKDNLHLIPSSLNLASLESDIVDMIKRNNQLDIGKFHDIEVFFRKQLGEEYDFILIDFCPSASSAINAIFMMMSDFFMVPVSPTFFSLQAIDNLESVFKNWVNLLQNQKRTTTTNGLSFTPKFLGIVVCMSKRRTTQGIERFTQATNEWTDLVNMRVKSFQQYNQDIGRSISEEKFKQIFPNREPFVIEKCCDFAMEIRTYAELKGIAEINLQENDLPKRTSYRKDKKGETEYVNQNIETLRIFKTSIQYIAKNLLKLLED